MDALSNVEIFERIVLSLLAGSIIGIEREWKNKPAGVRTYALVCEGSALFMISSILLSNEMARSGGTADAGDRLVHRRHPADAVAGEDEKPGTARGLPSVQSAASRASGRDRRRREDRTGDDVSRPRGLRNAGRSTVPASSARTSADGVCGLTDGVP